ncbi:MAG: hypothetical protein KO206_04040 [Methanomicrobiaceae archaeon]|uniref:RNase III domain-containing protein n=1 Tax=hydrocarbon metagenome TaxID=938273 RepID=A0A0W8FF60_9ZZZZ|nr:hypothetical protein [Methanomicrobiaceae archaeon]MDD5418622.1 ribonuclease III domain-containing protein [Methanomicrobiaceae archaeon]
MHESFQWKRVDIEAKLNLLRQGVAAGCAANPVTGRRERKKIEGWIRDLDSMQKKIGAIQGGIRHAIERDLGYRLNDPEMLAIAMFQQSTRNLFDEIRLHAQGSGGCGLSEEELRELAALPEAAKVLAWIGDAALKIGLLPEIWNPSMAEVGFLTERRKAYDRNANLAHLCDRWSLYEHRIHFDPSEERSRRRLNHLKGTLVESVYGMLFLQGGLKAIAPAARLLKPGGVLP